MEQLITPFFGTVSIILSLFVIFNSLRISRVLGGFVGRALNLVTCGIIVSLISSFINGAWFMIDLSKRLPEAYLGTATIFLLILSNVFWILAGFELMKMDESLNPSKPRKKK